MGLTFVVTGVLVEAEVTDEDAAVVTTDDDTGFGDLALKHTI